MNINSFVIFSHLFAIKFAFLYYDMHTIFKYHGYHQYIVYHDYRGNGGITTDNIMVRISINSQSSFCIFYTSQVVFLTIYKLKFVQVQISGNLIPPCFNCISKWWILQGSSYERFQKACPKISHLKSCSLVTIFFTNTCTHYTSLIANIRHSYLSTCKPQNNCRVYYTIYCTSIVCFVVFDHDVHLLEMLIVV